MPLPADLQERLKDPSFWRACFFEDDGIGDEIDCRGVSGWWRLRLYPRHHDRPGRQGLRVRPVIGYLEHGGRRFQVMAYHDAIRHDGPALELAEIVDREVGPGLVTVLFSHDDPSEAEVLLTDSSLPLPVVTAFLKEAAREQDRLRRRADP
ncbi:hypothetical protein [Actinoplanes sp. HUAS TT8]|uniref:hypothetical protein n=1 Tax=Actinoplanes sp. HUAS TT8 TaxID=3447453 RepID=UPI003F520FEA